MPIVMVTEDEEAIQQYGSETEGVFVISFKVFPAGGCVCVFTSTVVLIRLWLPLAIQKRENKE